MLGTMTQKPADRLDYDISFAAWLDRNDSITAASISISQPGLTGSATAISPKIIKVWISDGTAGTTYTVTVTATTAQGRRKSESFKVRIRE